METTLTKERTRKTYVSPFEPIIQTEEMLTYEIIQQRKREQQRLIDMGIIVKPELKEGFSPKQWLDFQTAISIEDYAKERGIAI
ncbi:hypothetical protein FACS189434_13720 [Bacteroidia bacterium]|nr:hypothetical protein FACS189434_13720 [Bacteroidia bacterium]